jgi:hypothetical protein
MVTKKKSYRPREYGICPRCGEKRGVTQLSKAFGCLRCKEKLTPEQQEALHAALIEKNREQRAIDDGLQAAQEARQQINDARIETLGAPTGERAERQLRNADQMQAMATVHKLVAEADFIEKVDAAFAPAAALPRCACCFTPWHEGQPKYAETFDGKLFCRLCLYGVERCGACPIHNNVIYPEIAATVPRTKPEEYPPEVLNGFPVSLIGA